MQPNLDLCQGLNLEKWGYVVTDDDMRTNLEGIYAVGDGTIAAIQYRRSLIRMPQMHE